MNLSVAWQQRLNLRAESDKLRAESDKLRYESNKLRAEGDKIRAESDKLWAEAILEIHGNVEMKWILRGDVLDCHLETGEFFKGDDAVATKPQEAQ